LKSSSRFFPVEIISAEMRDKYFEDSYSLKPNNSEDVTVEISLTHIHPIVESKNSQVLLVHDAFQSHWQFEEAPYEQLASSLLEAGYTVWLMDWRSHGSSKKNKDASKNYVKQMAQFDLPSVIQFINEKRPHTIHLISEGYGAQLALQSIRHSLPVYRYYCVDAKSLRAKKRYWIPGSKLLKRFKLLGKTWIKGAGTEYEHSAFFKHELKRHGLLSYVMDKEAKPAMLALKEAASRVYWLASSRSGVSLARRHLKQQARIRKSDRSQLSSELFNLIENEHQG
jgi:alpha-beta hydrolase superfamily lysophospholipase